MKFKIIIFIMFIGIITFIFNVPAQGQSCGSATPARATGLVTTPKLLGQFGTTGGGGTAFLSWEQPITMGCR